MTDDDNSSSYHGKIIIVEERKNPSTDYYVLPAVAGHGGEVVSFGFERIPEVKDLDGATVIFVRYVPKAWVKLIEQVRPRLQRLIYFMDDDLLDARALKGMPWKYRLKLMRLAVRRKAWLQKQGAELWVSTPYLAKKYAGWTPKLVSPSPIAPVAESRCRVFYHGSASHVDEIRWLRKLVEPLLRGDEGLSFEIIGDYKVNRLYRELDRATIVHPMSWPAYQAFLAVPGRHVGLVPVLGSQFNTARSYTKFFDITRCGAVGVYSRDSVYAEIVSDGVDGLLVDQNLEAWQQAVLMLAGDESLRQQMLQNARARMAAMMKADSDLIRRV